MTFGEKLFEAFAARRKSSAPIAKEEWVAIADRVAHAEGIARKKQPKGAGRARNPLYDALALATGTKDLAQITRNAGKAIGVALADIMEVCPDLTVEEINRRAAAYKRRWPDPRNWSASALAKHWPEYGGAPTRTGYDCAPEPKGDWRPAAMRAAEKTVDPAVRRSRVEAIQERFAWVQIGPEFRKLIFDELKGGA